LSSTFGTRGEYCPDDNSNRYQRWGKKKNRRREEVDAHRYRHTEPQGGYQTNHSPTREQPRNNEGGAKAQAPRRRVTAMPPATAIGIAASDPAARPKFIAWVPSRDTVDRAIRSGWTNPRFFAESRDSGDGVGTVVTRDDARYGTDGAEARRHHSDGGSEYGQ